MVGFHRVEEILESQARKAVPDHFRSWTAQDQISPEESSRGSCFLLIHGWHLQGQTDL